MYLKCQCENTKAFYFEYSNNELVLFFFSDSEMDNPTIEIINQLKQDIQTVTFCRKYFYFLFYTA